MPYSNKSNPTGQQAGSAPALINYDNFLIAAYQKNDGSGEILCINSQDGSNWGGPVSIGLASKGIPALGILHGELYCMTPDADDQSTLSTVKYAHGWGGLNKTSLQVASGSSVSLANLTVDGVETLFCAFKGTDSRLTIASTTDGEHWSVTKTDVNTFTTPALSVLNDQLVCTFIQDIKSNIVWTAVSAGGQNWQIHKSLFASSEHVATTTIQWNEVETLVCGYINEGFEGQLSVMATHDGANWYNLFPEPSSGVSCNNTTPGVAALGSELVFLLQTAGNNLDVFTVKQAGNILKPKQSLDGFDIQFMRRDFVDFHIDQNASLYGIYKGSTASGNIEIVKSIAENGLYGGAVSHDQVALSIDQGDWTFFMDSSQNLIGVLRSGSASGKMEIFEMSAASGYQEKTNHYVTTMDFPAASDQFVMSPKKDLYKFDADHKVSQLMADSGYAKINTYAPRADGNYGKGPVKYQVDAFGNIYGFQLNGPEQYQVKMYGFSYASQYQQMNINHVQFPVLTCLPSLGLNHQILFDGQMNLHVIDTDPIGRSFMTHRLLPATSAYNTQSKVQDTAFSKVVNPQFKLNEGEIAFSQGLSASGGTWKISNLSSPYQAINRSVLGSSIPTNEISSVQLGPKTGVSVTPSGGSQASDYYVDSDYINGIDEFKLIATETAKNAGLSYSILLTEDYRYVNNQLEKFTSYQTILKFVDPPAHVQVFCDQQTKIDCGKEIYAADNVNGVSVPVPSTSDSLVLSVEALAIGTAPLRIQTPTMKSDEFVVIFPDQQVHHKIANLPEDAILKNQDQLKLATPLTPDGASQVQKAVQNMARASKYPANGSPYSNTGPMDDAHWQVNFQGNVPSYNKLTPEQSMAILHGSQAIQAGGAHGIFDDLFHDMSKVVSITVHSVSHAFTEAADDVESGINTLAGDIEQAGEDLARDIRMTIQLVDKAFTFAMNHTAIGRAIGSVFHKIGAAINDVITFFSALFDWQEIERISGVLVNMMTSTLHSAEKELATIKSDVDTYFNKAEKDVNNLIDTIREELGLPNEEASSPIGGEIIHGIMWFISKLQEFASDIIPSPPSEGDSSSGSGINLNLESIGDELLEQVLNDINTVISTFVNTIVNAISDPSKADKIFLGGMLSIAQEIADDAINLAEDVFNLLIDKVEEVIQKLINDLNSPLQIPFISDLFKLGGVNAPSAAELMAVALAMPLTVYEKESNTTVFANGAGLSYEISIAGNKDAKVINSIVSVLSGMVNSIKGLPKATPILGYVAVAINLVAQSVRSPYLQHISITDQGIPVPNGPGLTRAQNTPEYKALEKAQKTFGIWWGYQFFPIVMDFVFCVGNHAQKNINTRLKAAGKRKQEPLNAALFNSLLQIPRIIGYIVNLTAHDTKKSDGTTDENITNSSYFSGTQIAADFLTTLPPFISLISKYGEDNDHALLAGLTLQNLVMDIYAGLIWADPEKTPLVDV